MGRKESVVSRRGHQPRIPPKELSAPGQPIWAVWSQADEIGVVQLHVEHMTYLSAWEVLYMIRETMPHLCGVYSPNWDGKEQ